MSGSNTTIDEDAHPTLKTLLRVHTLAMICYHMGKHIFHHTRRFPERDMHHTANMFTQNLKSFLRKR